MEKENLYNGIKPDVSDNEALRVAVAFAEWIMKKEFIVDYDISKMKYRWLYVGDKILEDGEYYTTEKLYTMFEAESKSN